MTTPYDTSRLREAWRELAEMERSVDGCPDPERIWEAVRGVLDSAATRDMVEHVATCPACAEAWRLARELVPAEEAVESPPTRGRKGGWVAMAAMVVLAATLAWRFVDWPWLETTERGSGVVVESLLPDGTTLPREDFELAWKAGPEGTRYDLLLTTPDLVVVDRASGLEEARYRVPVSVLDPVAADGELLWRVEMVLADGRHVASPAFRVRIK